METPGVEVPQRTLLMKVRKVVSTLLAIAGAAGLIIFVLRRRIAGETEIAWLLAAAGASILGYLVADPTERRDLRDVFS